MELRLSPQELETVAVYEGRIRAGHVDTTPIWADRFSTSVFWSLPGSGEIVDVGCGTGRFIPILTDLNIPAYLGIDPCEGNVEYCRKNFPAHNFSLGSVQTLGERFPERFAGFIMATSLMHVPRRGLKQALRSLRKSLIPGAQGMISLPLGEPLTWRHGDGVTLTLYTEAEMERQLPLHDFKISRMFSPNGHMLLIHVEAA